MPNYNLPDPLPHSKRFTGYPNPNPPPNQSAKAQDQLKLQQETQSPTKYPRPQEPTKIYHIPPEFPVGIFVRLRARPSIDTPRSKQFHQQADGNWYTTAIYQVVRVGMRKLYRSESIGENNKGMAMDMAMATATQYTLRVAVQDEALDALEVGTVAIWDFTHVEIVAVKSLS